MEFSYGREGGGGYQKITKDHQGGGGGGHKKITEDQDHKVGDVHQILATQKVHIGTLILVPDIIYMTEFNKYYHIM